MVAPDRRTWWDPTRPSITLLELAQARRVLAAPVQTADVDERFRAEPKRRSVVVERSGGGWRLLNRAAFYQALVGPRGFGLPLFFAKPIEELPVPDALALPGEVDAVEAGTWLLSQPDLSGADDLLVTGGRWPATIGVSELLAGVAAAHDAQASQFRTLVQHLSDVVCVVDAGGKVRYLSPAWERLAAGEVPDRVGGSATALVPAPDQGRLAELLAACRRQPGVPVEGELRLAFGPARWRSFEVVAADLTTDPAMGGYLLTFRDVTDRRRLEAELHHQAHHDDLTGLANRALLLDRAGQGLADDRRHDRGLAVVWVDIDGFGAINHTCGAAAGDAVLHAVAARLCREVRPGDSVARVGGDEFAVLLQGVGSAAGAANVAARLHRSLDAPVEVDGRTLAVRASLGVAMGDAVVEADELLRRAELAKGAAKAAGRNRTVVWHPEMEAELHAEQQLVVDLGTGLASGQFSLQYQPIVDLGNGRVVAVEALARWAHPQLGPVPPGRFIPLAERSGAIAGLTRWVLGAACRQAAAWVAADPGRPLVVAVNLSAAELGRPDLTSDVVGALAASGLPAERLELELTETALVADVATARAALSSLKALGVGVAIDDFGTGYSSLSYLGELPVDRMKVDKAFVDRLGAGAEGTDLVRGLVQLAHSLGLRVTAEGVEHPAQRDALAGMGCDDAQGYLFARPAPAGDLGLGPAVDDDPGARRAQASVTAPRSAPETSLANFASTPLR